MGNMLKGPPPVPQSSRATDFAATKGTVITQTGATEMRAGDKYVGFRRVESGRLDVYVLMSMDKSQGQVHTGLAFLAGKEEINPYSSPSFWKLMLVHVTPDENNKAKTQVNFRFWDSITGAEADLQQVVDGKAVHAYVGERSVDCVLACLTDTANHDVELPFRVKGDSDTIDCARFCQSVLGRLGLSLPTGWLYAELKEEMGDQVARAFLASL